MLDLIWTWNGHEAYWAASSPAFTAVVVRGVRHWDSRLVDLERGRVQRVWRRVWTATAPGMQAPSERSRYQVAIAGPDYPERGAPGHVERYVLAGSLLEVRAKVAAALARRQAAWDAWRARRPLLASGGVDSDDD